MWGSWASHLLPDAGGALEDVTLCAGASPGAWRLALREPGLRIARRIGELLQQQ